MLKAKCDSSILFVLLNVKNRGIGLEEFGVMYVLTTPWHVRSYSATSIIRTLLVGPNVWWIVARNESQDLDYPDSFKCSQEVWIIKVALYIEKTHVDILIAYSV